MKIQIENNKISLDDLEELCKKLKEQKEEEKKHLNGYIFDSLVYRYMIARDKQAEYEIMMDRRNGGNRDEIFRSRANRDKMRFIEILDEVIGEHD